MDEPRNRNPAQGPMPATALMTSAMLLLGFCAWTEGLKMAAFWTLPTILAVAWLIWHTNRTP